MIETYTSLAESLGVKTISSISWAHAVNSKKDLVQYINDPGVQIVEGDISVSVQGDVIMAHPPVVESDLTLNEWAKKIAQAHKGLKLDFKVETGVVEGLKLMESLHTNTPVFINADVLKGPGGGDPIIPGSWLIENCTQYFPRGLLSVGWKTGCPNNEGYTDLHINEMLQLVKNYPGLVTFPVRAYYLKNSEKELNRLIENEKYSLSIWNNEPTDKGFEQWVTDHFDSNKYFIDLISNTRLSELGHI